MQRQRERERDSGEEEDSGRAEEDAFIREESCMHTSHYMPAYMTYIGARHTYMHAHASF